MPETQVIAVGASGAPAMVESLQSGRMVSHDRIDTIADGIGVRVPVPEALDDLRGLVDELILVPDDGHPARHAPAAPARRGRRRAVRRGRAGRARAGAGTLRGQTVGTIICGGNLTPAQMRDWLVEPA